MGFLAGKRILITGLLSNRSIAYGVAKAARREGADLAFTYQNERFKDRVTEMAGEFGSTLVFPCDVASDAEIAALFSELAGKWTALDGLVHAIAFAPRKGIRVNAVSAGPIKTLAASGISGFSKILKYVEENSPLRRNVTTGDVGNVAAFLLSDLAAGVTGEITYVDGGFNTVVGAITASGASE